jgi:hypothetical protein
VQVTRLVVVEQKLPAPLLHSLGAGGHAHEALGKLPPQTRPAPQLSVLMVTRQLLPSRPQVASLPARQILPADAQSLGGVGQVQLAFGKPPRQVRLPVQLSRPVITTHPLAGSAPQWIT